MRKFNKSEDFMFETFEVDELISYKNSSYKVHKISSVKLVLQNPEDNKLFELTFDAWEPPTILND